VTVVISSTIINCKLNENDTIKKISLKSKDVNPELKVGKLIVIEQHGKEKSKLKYIPPIITTFSASK
jgi:hypothetical protein